MQQVPLRFETAMQTNAASRVWFTRSVNQQSRGGDSFGGCAVPNVGSSFKDAELAVLDALLRVAAVQVNGVPASEQNADAKPDLSSNPVSVQHALQVISAVPAQHWSQVAAALQPKQREDMHLRFLQFGQALLDDVREMGQGVSALRLIKERRRQRLVSKWKPCRERMQRHVRGAKCGVRVLNGVRWGSACCTQTPRPHDQTAHRGQLFLVCIGGVCRIICELGFGSKRAHRVGFDSRLALVHETQQFRRQTRVLVHGPKGSFRHGDCVRVHCITCGVHASMAHVQNLHRAAQFIHLACGYACGSARHFSFHALQALE